MKKIAQSLLIIFIVCLFITSCHKHTFAVEYSFDDVNHWHEATCGHSVVDDKSAHSFVNGKCKVCGFLDAWNITNKGVLSVKDKQLIKGEVTIPSKVNNTSVTAITRRAFYECKNLTDVIIPDSVLRIAEDAFSTCTNLVSVYIPDSVVSIGGGAFAYCKSLKNITIPDSISSIEGAVFADCTSLTSITIPDSVTSIENYAFDGCSNLSSVTISDSVSFIGPCAFGGCTNLKNITFTGTKAQWNAMKRSEGGIFGWNYRVPAKVVHCSDGDVAI